VAVSGLTADAAAEFELLAALTGGGLEFWRVLIALNAMIPDTATTWRTNTISNARDNFMLGPPISS
jgi:hypothetical protein